MTLPAPFADDSQSASIGSLTVENGRDSIALYGNLDITRDKAGLATARQLAAYLEKIVGALQADAALPDRLPPPPAAKTVPNPFS